MIFVKRLLTAAALGVGGFAATLAGASGASAATAGNDLADTSISLDDNTLDASDLDVVDVDEVDVEAQDLVTTKPLINASNALDSINALGTFHGPHSR